MRNAKWIRAFVGVIAVGIAMAAMTNTAKAEDRVALEDDVAAYMYIYQLNDFDTIPYGITVGGIDVGGLTATEAAKRVSSILEERLQTTVSFSLGAESRVYTVKEMGIHFDVSAEDIVKAATLGKSGTLLARYCEKATLASEGFDYPISFHVDEGVASELVRAFAEEVEQEPIEATVERVNGAFVVTPDQTGIAVDVRSTTTILENELKNWNGSAIEMDVVAEITYAEKTAAALSTISDKLAGFSTICGDLTSNRGMNVMAGAAKLDGQVIMPGEQFSVVDCLAPFTVENGYYVGVAFNNGGYMDSIGGGVCSLSSTLYNALLRAEIQIDARWNHSMVVSYCEWGFDSTVNDDGSRDLIFTNNTGYPIYIEAYGVYGVPDGWLYFNIYGTETRDMSRRYLHFYNDVIASEYADVSEYTIIEDPSLPYGTQVWDQGTYPYAVVDAYKDVYMDGQLVSHELLHRDTYRKSAAIIRQNTTNPDVTEESAEGEP